MSARPRDIVSVWRWPLRRWVQDLAADLKQGLRLVRRSPVFTMTAVIVLSLGIGVNTALFSVINALFFTSLPVKAPDELFYIYTKNEAGQVMTHVDMDCLTSSIHAVMRWRISPGCAWAGRRHQR